MASCSRSSSFDALRDDPAVARTAELSIKNRHLSGLLRLRQRFQVPLDAALRRSDLIAHWRQASDVDTIKIRSEGRQKIAFRLDFKQPAKRLDRLIERGRAAYGLAPGHQVEIGVVDHRCNRLKNSFVHLPDGMRQFTPSSRNSHAIRDSLIENVSCSFIVACATSISSLWLSSSAPQRLQSWSSSGAIAGRFRRQFRLFGSHSRPPSTAGRTPQAHSHPPRGGATRRSPACSAKQFRVLSC